MVIIMDRRQKKTKKAIYMAFAKLLKTNKYENIIVQDIIDEANICRSTFYAHFETKDTLLKELCSDIFNHIFNKDDCEYHEKPDEIESRLAHILFHLKNSEIELTTILSGESKDLFLHYLKEYLINFFETHLSFFSNKVPKDFLLSHLVGSFSEAIIWWSKNNMEQAPELIAKYFVSIIEKH